ncbi:MAG: flagellar export protein FliJ [Desulfococcaceae bacterium]|jgi:flagellar export protein FliJ|nr:flagellar export protein FliJ [Desulfococcaceae bacterium]
MYKFRFETLLRHRRFLEDRMKEALADAVRQLRGEEAALQQLKARKEEYGKREKEKCGQGLSISEKLLYSDFSEHLEKEISARKKSLTDAEKNAGKKREQLTPAVQKRKMLEKLKAQKAEIHDREMLKQEIKFYSDISVNRFIRKQPETQDSEPV